MKVLNVKPYHKRCQILNSIEAALCAITLAAQGAGRVVFYEVEPRRYVLAMAGGAEEYHGFLGSLALAWAAVGSTPVVGGNASGLGRMLIPAKTKLAGIVSRLSGSWDQSVGNETQATDGCLELIQSLQLNLDGKVRRPFSGPILFELNRIVNRGAGPQTDPAVGVGNGKAFSALLYHDMGFFDAEGPISNEDPRAYRESTYLDLGLYQNAFIELQGAPFSAYVSGNTQANMAATMAFTTVEIIGAPPNLPQTHFEAQLVNNVDMTSTGVDRIIQLNREGLIIRGVLARVGTLSATPRVLAVTALPQIGIEGKPKAGGRIISKDKQPVAVYQNEVAIGRNGIQLRAGHVLIDLANNRKRSSHLVGSTYDDLRARYDVTGTANSTMELYELVKTR